MICIVADDLGYGDLGCYGGTEVVTPHLDGLAREGLRAERHYTWPVCTPSRAALLTGHSPEHVGLQEALMGHGGLTKPVATLPGWLRAHGYRTGLVGKWHLGYSGAALPRQHGYDEFFGHLGGKLHYDRHTDELEGFERPDLWENEQPVTRSGYATELFTDRAVEFIRTHAERPFFLMLAYNAPHYARGIRAGESHPVNHHLQAPPAYLARFARNPDQPTMREMYAAVVSALDDGVGRVMQAVRDVGLDESALVLFQSDHGADPKHGGHNGPLSGHKAQLGEGGIRVPMLVRLPGVLPAGRVLPGPSDVRDVWPTAAALLELADPPPLEGHDESMAWRSGQPGRVCDRCFAFRQERVVIRGPWKWMQREGVTRLHQVVTDPAEQVDLHAQHPELAAAMAHAWAQWAQTWAGS